GLMAIVNQGRALAGKGSLDGYTQTLPALYQLPAGDFRDPTSGSNGGYSAGPGFDLVTGRGSPIANLVVRDLVGGSTRPSSPPPPRRPSPRARRSPHRGRRPPTCPSWAPARPASPP